MGGNGDNFYYLELFARPYPSTKAECFPPEGQLPDWLRAVLSAVEPQY